MALRSELIVTKLFKLIAITLFILLLTPTMLLASNKSLLQEDFRKANALYAKGKYKQALEDYQMIDKLLLGRKSPSLYYNIANTYYRLGKYPYALLFYLKAEKLDPWDKDLAENIRLCREKLKIEEKNNFFELISRIRVELWMCMLCIIFWLCIFVWLLRFNIAYKTAILIFLLLIGTLTSTGLILSFCWHNTPRYVVLEETKLFSGPSNKESVLAVLEPGVILKGVSQMRSWIKVKAPEGITGWAQGSRLGKI